MRQSKRISGLSVRAKESVSNGPVDTLVLSSVMVHLATSASLVRLSGLLRKYSHQTLFRTNRTLSGRLKSLDFHRQSRDQGGLWSSGPMSSLDSTLYLPISPSIYWLIYHIFQATLDVPCAVPRGIFSIRQHGFIPTSSPCRFKIFNKS